MKVKNVDWLQLPKEGNDTFINFQSFCVILKGNAPVSRNELMQIFLDNGVATRRGVMTTHRESAYKNSSNYNLPISEKVHDQSILLPLYVPMEFKDSDKIIEILRSV